LTAKINHYADQYWNDLPAVLSYLCKRATGDSSLWWMDYFKKHYATPPRRRALVFGCGTGWVERDLFDRKVAETFDAFDSSSDYLAIAKGQRGERPIHYAQSNFDGYVPQVSYDLIVNVASLHHVRFLFRMVDLLSRALDPDGLFVHWEYIGPSRNQYSASHVAILRGINQSLPERFRTPHPLRHDLRTFLAGDPTEAIHSADILRALDEYFEPVERKVLGGGVAYQLLWNNLSEYRKDDEEARAILESLLRLDESLTSTGAVPPLFAFLIYRHRARRRSLSAAIDRFVREPLRERFADLTGGLYPTDLVRGKRWLERFRPGSSRSG
jgi:SAM-dependent methyltransferase